MKNKFFYIVKMACPYILILVFSCFFCMVPAMAETPDDYWPPWVTKTTTHSATINWRGQSDGMGLIEYAKSSHYVKHHRFERKITSRRMAQYQHVRLPGLKPNTSYTYRVRPTGNEDGFANRTFRTMPVRGPFTFIVISDSQEGHHYNESQRFRYVAEEIAKEPDVLFILHGGDFARFDDEQRWAIFFQVADVMLAKSAIFPTIGNHEYHNINDSSGPPTNADHYHAAFDMPLNYSFRCAGIRFISLNTSDPANANYDDPQTSLALVQSQESWLRHQLEKKC
jgi:Phosphodiesterase/alkaline phosphatase D